MFMQLPALNTEHHHSHTNSFRWGWFVWINPVPHLLPFPHVWQNLNWSRPRSYKRRSIVVSSAWEAVLFTAAMGRDPVMCFFSLHNNTLCCFHLCVFEVVFSASFIHILKNIKKGEDTHNTHGCPLHTVCSCYLIPSGGFRSFPGYHSC